MPLPLASSAEPAEDASTSLASVGRSAALLSVGALAAQILVAVREIFLASQSGTSSGVDALYVGVLLPLALGGVISSGTAVALVPVYLSARSQGKHADAQRFAGVALGWVSIGGLILTAGLIVFAPDVVAIMGSGLASADQADAAAYLRISAPVVAVSAVNGILVAVCQSLRHFRPIAVALVVNAATALLIMIALWSALDLTGYAVATLLGPMAGAVVVAITMARLSVLPRPRLRAHGMPVRAFLSHAFPLTISSSILQLNIVIDSAIASLLQPGSVSALRFGHLLVNAPVGAFSVAWSSAIYPTLVGSSLAPEGSRLAWVTDRGLRYALAMFIPIASLTMAVAPLAVAVVFGRGMFSNASIELTASVVVGMAPTIALAMAIPVVVGALNARRKGTVLLAAGILNVALNAILNVVLGFSLGVVGIALSTSITMAVVLVFFSGRVSRMEPGFHLRPIATTFGRAAIAVAPATVVVAMIVWSSWSAFSTLQGILALAVFAVAGLTSYVVLAPWFGLGEPRIIVSAALRETSRVLPRR